MEKHIYKVVSNELPTDVTKTLDGVYQFSDKLTSEQAIEVIKRLNEAQVGAVEKGQEFTVSLNLKSLYFNVRVEVMKWALSCEDLIDSTLILNIFNLIKNHNTCDESFFNSESVIVNNKLEFIDLKTKLKEELAKFCNELAVYYYSIFRTAGVTDFPANNLPKIIPLIYQRVLLISDFISMSNIVRPITEIKNLVYVENAEKFLQSLSTRYMIANLLIAKAGLNKPKKEEKNDSKA